MDSVRRREISGATFRATLLVGVKGRMALIKPYDT
jgi:hypothetical protein